MPQRQLSLLRHAKSSWDNAALADEERPLAPRGLRASARLAAHVVDQPVPPGLVLCSPALRARQTVEPLVERLGDRVELRIEPVIYDGGAEDLLEVIRDLADDVSHALVVGHLPIVQDLARLLAGGGDGRALARLRAKFPTAALATLAVRGRWSSIEPGGAELVDFVTVKELEPGPDR